MLTLPQQKSLLKDLNVSEIADHKYYLEGKERRLLHRVVCTPGTRVRISQDGQTTRIQRAKACTGSLAQLAQGRAQLLTPLLAASSLLGMLMTQSLMVP